MLASSSEGSASEGSLSEGSASDGFIDDKADRLSDAGTNDDEYVYYPTASETCTDNQIVFDALMSYLEVAKMNFSTELLKLRSGTDESESQQKKDKRKSLIEYQIFEQTEYNKICEMLKEHVDAMRLDISHAKSDWVQDFYLNFLNGTGWCEHYFDEIYCGTCELEESFDDDDDGEVSDEDGGGGDESRS